MITNRDITNAVSGKVGIGVSLDKLRTIGTTARFARAGSLHVDRWPWGRDALQAAIGRGGDALMLHSFKIGGPDRRAIKAAAFVEAIDAVKTAAALAPFNKELGNAAEAFVRVAQKLNHYRDEPTPPHIGSPGTMVHRAMAEAAAAIYAANTGKPIPRAGIKGDHPLKD